MYPDNARFDNALLRSLLILVVLVLVAPVANEMIAALPIDAGAGQQLLAQADAVLVGQR